MANWNTCSAYIYIDNLHYEMAIEHEMYGDETDDMKLMLDELLRIGEEKSKGD